MKIVLIALALAGALLEAGCMSSTRASTVVTADAQVLSIVSTSSDDLREGRLKTTIEVVYTTIPKFDGQYVRTLIISRSVGGGRKETFHCGTIISRRIEHELCSVLQRKRGKQECCNALLPAVVSVCCVNMREKYAP